MHRMRQRAGEHRLQHVIAAVVQRIIANQPVDLLGHGMRGRPLVVAHQRAEGLRPSRRLRGIVGQGGQQVGVAGLHPIEQAPALDFDLEELEHVQRRRVADHILGIVPAQHMAADLGVRWQVARRDVQAAAARVRMGGLEHVGDRLDLPDPARGIGQPGGVVVLGRGPGRVLLSLQLGRAAGLDEGGDGLAKAPGPRSGVKLFGHMSPFWSERGSVPAGCSIPAQAPAALRQSKDSTLQ